MSDEAQQGPADLVVIGGGTMARAIVEGGIAAGVLSPARVVVAEPDLEKHGLFEALGVAAVRENAGAMHMLGRHGRVLLAVKPQTLAAVGADLRPFFGVDDGPGVVSILAGTPAMKVSDALGGNARVVRAMPNTPARVRRGMTAVAAGTGVDHDTAAFAVALFEALGSVIRIDENLMDAFTAVAGSGPAYVFYLAQAMVRSGVALGFDESTAQAMVRGTMAGAGELMRLSDETPWALLAGVQSKGGTTEAALRVLQGAGVEETVVQALTAARDRGRELSALV